MSERRQLPAFESEAEEAAWWYDNREEHDAAFAEAIRDGRARRSTLEERLAVARSIQLDAEDESKARKMAKNKGVEYKEFVRTLVHDELMRLHAAA